MLADIRLSEADRASKLAEINARLTANITNLKNAHQDRIAQLEMTKLSFANDIQKMYTQAGLSERLAAAQNYNPFANLPNVNQEETPRISSPSGPIIQDGRIKQFNPLTGRFEWLTLEEARKKTYA